MYDIDAIANDTIALSYELDKLNTVFSVFMWVRLCSNVNNTTTTIFDLINNTEGGDTQKITVEYNDTTKRFNMRIDDNISIIDIEATGQDIAIDKIYGIAIRYDIDADFASISVIDEERTYIQENYIDNNIVRIDKFDNLYIYGAFGSVTNIRPVNVSVARNNIFDYLFDASADYINESVFFDKGIPEMIQNESPTDFEILA